MAAKDKDDSANIDVRVVPVANGGVTTLNGDQTISFGQGDNQPPRSPSNNWGGYPPVVMPQPSIIVVTVDKKPAKKEAKAHSEVFKRP